MQSDVALILVQDYSVVLVIPDFYERAYIRDFINLLLIAIGFKQVCVQQVISILNRNCTLVQQSNSRNRWPQLTAPGYRMRV